jgi:hypothetical protein
MLGPSMIGKRLEFFAEDEHPGPISQGFETLLAIKGDGFWDGIC